MDFLRNLRRGLTRNLISLEGSYHKQRVSLHSLEHVEGTSLEFDHLYAVMAHMSFTW